MKHNLKLAAAVALVVIASGCQVKAPATVDQEGTIGGKTSAGKTGAVQPGKTGTIGANGSATIGAGATGGAASGGAAFDPAKLPTQQQALAGAKAMTVTAQAGGMYRSADGTLTADIPPGALSQDTTIKVARIDTSNIPASDYFVPGIMFSVDLGGAQLAPDTQIMVKAEVDSRFIDEMKAKDPQFTMDRYALSQVDGKFYMSMPVKGPSSVSVDAPKTTPTLNAWNLNEFGGLPLPGASANASFSVQYIDGSYDYDYEEVRLSNGQVITAPRTTTEWGQMESRGVFGCGAFPHCYYYGKLVTRNKLKPQRDSLVSQAKALRAKIPAADLADPATKNPDVATLKGLEDGIRSLDAQADAAGQDCNIVVTPAAIKTHTTWVSDDPALNGKDASGVTVRFSMDLQNPVAGPSQVISDGSGNANSHAQAGTAVTITPWMALGNTTGQSASIGALQAAQPTTELKLTKNSPRITLNLSTADTAFSGNVSVRYALDGTEATASFPVSGKNAQVSFYVIVPNDADHTFALKEVTNGDQSAPKLPGSIAVHRTGSYSQSVALMNTAAK